LEEKRTSCVANNNEFPSVIEVYDKIKANSNFGILSSDINDIYNTVKKKTNLKLKYLVYSSEEFENSNYHEDGKGRNRLLVFTWGLFC
jgi:hypothetical protein